MEEEAGERGKREEKKDLGGGKKREEGEGRVEGRGRDIERGG